MKTTNFENVLALAGALIVLVGVSAAANSALADETGMSEKEAAVADFTQAISDSASQATSDAIDDAILTVRLDNQWDLDIRLLDRTSLTASEL